MSNTFDAGSIESRLVLDRTDFTDGLREAKAEGENFARQKFEASIKIDTSDAIRSVASVRAELATLRNTQLNIGIGSSGSSNIVAIRQQMAGLSGQNLNIGVTVTGLADANAGLRTLRQNVNALDGRQININVNADTASALAQLAAVQAALNRLDGQTATVNTRTATFSSLMQKAGLGMMDVAAAAMLAAPAIFPLVNATLAAAGAFTTLAVSAGAAVGIFGLATFGAIKNITGLNKTLDKAKKALDTQREALSKLTPGTDAYALQLKKVEDAQLAVNAANEAFSPTQRRAADAMGDVKVAWQDFIQATESSTLPVVTTFLRAAGEGLPKLVPVVRAIGPEFAAIGASFRGWVNDGGLERFVNFLVKTGVPAFRNLWLSAVNLSTVMGNLFRAFSGGAGDMSRSILSVTKAMALWSSQGGFERFIERVKANSGQVREFFGSLWQALKNIHAALAPLGPLGLGFVTILLKMVAALPPSWIQAVYLGFIAWRAILILVTIFNALKTAILAVRSAMFLLSIAFSITPIGWIVIAIGLLVAIIVVVGLKMGWLQKAWTAAWNGIKTAALWAWNQVIKPAFEGIKTGLKAVGDAAMWLWTKAIKPAFNLIWTAARLLVVILGTVLFTPLYLAFKLLRFAVMFLWEHGFKQLFEFVVAGAKIFWIAIKIQFGLLIQMLKIVGGWVKWLWDKAFKPVFERIRTGALIWWAALKIVFGKVEDGMKKVGTWVKWLWDHAFKPVFKWISDGAKAFYERGIKPPLDNVIAIFKTVGGWAKWLWNKGIKPQWDAITTGTGVFKKGMVSIFDKMTEGIGKAWKAIKKIAAVPINFLIDTVYNGGVVKVWNKIADAVGLDKMKLGSVGKIKYAKGGAITGAATGHDGVNVTAMAGEHIWTKDEVKNAGGHRAVAAMRSQFSSTGTARVAPGAESVADYQKGPGYFLGGGVIDWTKDSLGDAAGGLSDAWDATGGKVVSKAWDALKDVTRGAIGSVANPILKGIRGGVSKGIGGVIPGHPAWEDLAIGTGTKPINMILNWIKNDDAAQGMVGGGNTADALKFAKNQAGKPYVWGGVGPNGYDCSGFMSAIQNVIMGQSPYRRQWATGAFPPGAKGYKRDLKSPFEVGITNAGVGHTAGTLNGVNVESRGGKGVIVGKGARGAGDSLFNSQWGFTGALTGSTGTGGAGRWSETATAVLRELGVYSGGNLANVLKAIQKESGGNPNAVNNWDSNAQAGNPSKGLLQVIRTTFDQYAGKYRPKGQLDPYANIYAAVRYAKAAYGGGWSSRMAKPGGYKIGGPMVPGLSVVGEAGPELVASDGTHRVISASETARLVRGASGGGGGGVAVIPTAVSVRIGEREFLGMLDDETRATIAAIIKEAEGAR